MKKFKIVAGVIAVTLLAVIVATPFGIRYLCVHDMFVQINGDWKDQLVGASEGADRMIVEPQKGWFDPLPGPVEIRNADKIKMFRDIIEINVTLSGPVCDCKGDTWLRLFRGDKEVMLLSLHHGKCLRWDCGSWTGDARLTNRSQKLLRQWFAANGYEAWEKEREKTQGGGG